MDIHNWEYFILLVVASSFPLVFSLIHRKMLLNEGFRLFLPTIFVVTVPFVIWDIWATAVGHWSFNNRYVLGIYFFNIPIEELMFFILIPQNCLLIWVALNKYKSWKQLGNDIKMHFGRRK